MNYMLCKIGNAEDAETRRRVMVQALGALGGGTLGYLMTRYGLGIKGAGAGLAGAGLGAVGGAVAGDYLQRYGDYAKDVDEETAAKADDMKKKLNESIPETIGRHVVSPENLVVGGISAGMGLRGVGGPQGTYAQSVARRGDALTEEILGRAPLRARGRVTPGMLQRARQNIINQYGQHAPQMQRLDAIRNSGSALRRTGRMIGDVADENIHRLGRMARYGGISMAALPLLQTIVERTMLNPRRQAALNELGKK
jgi:hypothetical protein